MNGNMMDSEAGASDNRLSLSVGDFPFINNWEDGKEYDIKLTVAQQSNGEFTVVDASECESPAEDAGGESEAAEERDDEMSLSVFRNSTDLVIAHDVEDAYRVASEHIGHDYRDEHPASDDPMVRVDDATVLRLDISEDPSVPDPSLCECTGTEEHRSMAASKHHDPACKVARPSMEARQWVERFGRCFLGSSDY